MNCSIAILFWQISASTPQGFVHNIEILRDNMQPGQQVEISGIPPDNIAALKSLTNQVPSMTARIEDGKLKVWRFQ